MRVEGGHGLQLMHEIGVLSAALEPLPEPPRRIVARPCCRGSYLRGGFVAAGSVSGPRAAGHLEIRARDEDAAGVVVRIAAAEGVAMAVARRSSHAAAYVKSKAAIRDLLALMGAHDAVLAFEEAAVIAGTRERANRVTNFDRANLARLGGAARAQRDAIAALDLSNLRHPAARRSPSCGSGTRICRWPSWAAGPARRSRNRPSRAGCARSRRCTPGLIC